MTMTPEQFKRNRRESGRKGGLARVPKGYSMNPKLASESGKKANINRWGKPIEKKNIVDSGNDNRPGVSGIRHLRRNHEDNSQT